MYKRSSYDASMCDTLSITTTVSFFVNEHDVRSVLHWQVSFEHLHKSKDLFKA